jgi:hypothetical protein
MQQKHHPGRSNREVCHHLFHFYPSHKKLFDLIERAFSTGFLTTYDMKAGIKIFERIKSPNSLCILWA